MGDPDCLLKSVFLGGEGRGVCVCENCILIQKGKKINKQEKNIITMSYSKWCFENGKDWMARNDKFFNTDRGRLGS